MIYWNEYDDYTIIENESLEKLAQKYNLELYALKDVDNRINNWFKYAQVTSKKNNFDEIYEFAFTYYITEFFAEQGMSSGIENKYFLNRLDKKILNMYFHTTRYNVSEIEQKKIFYQSLVNFFKSDEIRAYEKHVFTHCVKVTDDIFEWFKKKGKTRDTIQALINGQIEKPYLNANNVGANRLVFLLNYSSEIRWKQLSTLDDRDRLRALLN